MDNDLLPKKTQNEQDTFAINEKQSKNQESLNSPMAQFKKTYYDSVIEDKDIIKDVEEKKRNIIDNINAMLPDTASKKGVRVKKNVVVDWDTVGEQLLGDWKMYEADYGRLVEETESVIEGCDEHIPYLKEQIEYLESKQAQKDIDNTIADYEKQINKLKKKLRAKSKNAPKSDEHRMELEYQVEELKNLQMKLNDAKDAKEHALEDAKKTSRNMKRRGGARSRI